VASKRGKLGGGRALGGPGPRFSLWSMGVNQQPWRAKRYGWRGLINHASCHDSLGQIGGRAGTLFSLSSHHKTLLISLNLSLIRPGQPNPWVEPRKGCVLGPPAAEWLPASVNECRGHRLTRWERARWDTGAGHTIAYQGGLDLGGHGQRSCGGQ